MGQRSTWPRRAGAVTRHAGHQSGNGCTRGLSPLAGPQGLEPRPTEPESVVLPLDDGPTANVSLRTRARPSQAEASDGAVPARTLRRTQRGAPAWVILASGRAAPGRARRVERCRSG